MAICKEHAGYEQWGVGLASREPQVPPQARENRAHPQLNLCSLSPNGAHPTMFCCPRSDGGQMLLQPHIQYCSALSQISCLQAREQQPAAHQGSHHYLLDPLLAVLHQALQSSPSSSTSTSGCRHLHHHQPGSEEKGRGEGEVRALMKARH